MYVYPLQTDHTSSKSIPNNLFLDSSLLLLNIFDTPGECRMKCILTVLTIMIIMILFPLIEMCWYKLQALLAVQDPSCELVMLIIIYNCLEHV